jgi:hypothetical protein
MFSGLKIGFGLMTVTGKIINVDGWVEGWKGFVELGFGFV